jgi:hypothetical protein
VQQLGCQRSVEIMLAKNQGIRMNENRKDIQVAAETTDHVRAQWQRPEWRKQDAKMAETTALNTTDSVVLS